MLVGGDVAWSVLSDQAPKHNPHAWPSMLTQPRGVGETPPKNRWKCPLPLQGDTDDHSHWLTMSGQHWPVPSACVHGRQTRNQGPPSTGGPGFLPVRTTPATGVTGEGSSRQTQDPGTPHLPLATHTPRLHWGWDHVFLSPMSSTATWDLLKPPSPTFRQVLVRPCPWAFRSKHRIKNPHGRSPPRGASS